MRGVCFRRGVSSACVLGFSIAAAPAAAQVIDPPAAAPAEPSVAPETWTYSGGSVPTGYHVEQQPRRGLVTAGALTLGIPWALGVAIASSRDFSNQSAWLVVPVLGPWFNIAARKSETTCDYDGDACYVVKDHSFQAMMIVDGLTQAAGAIMVIYGLASPKQVVTPDLPGRLHFAPATMGKLGYGGALSGEF